MADVSPTAAGLRTAVGTAWPSTAWVSTASRLPTTVADATLAAPRGEPPGASTRRSQSGHT